MLQKDITNVTLLNADAEEEEGPEKRRAIDTNDGENEGSEAETAEAPLTPPKSRPKTKDGL